MEKAIKKNPKYDYVQPTIDTGKLEKSVQEP